MVKRTEFFYFYFYYEVKVDEIKGKGVFYSYSGILFVFCLKITTRKMTTEDIHWKYLQLLKM